MARVSEVLRYWKRTWGAGDSTIVIKGGLDNWSCDLNEIISYASRKKTERRTSRSIAGEIFVVAFKGLGVRTLGAGVLGAMTGNLLETADRVDVGMG